MKKLLDTFFALCQGFGIAYVIASPLLLWRANVDAKFWEKAYADSCALFTKQDSIIVEQGHMIDKLLKAGASVRVFDPVAMDECKRRIGDTVIYCKNMYDAADGADVF